jgi:hypothetical protein
LTLASRVKLILVARSARAKARERRSSAARASLRPRAENGLNLTLLLYQRFAGFRRAAEDSSQRSTFAVIV